jgi:hypothetical protein
VAVLGLTAGLLALGFGAVAADLLRPAPAREEAGRLTRSLGLTDLALGTEARYLRHQSLADLHSAFQDHPAAMEHFPAGMLIAPPAHLRKPPAAPTPPSSDASLD